MGIQFHATLEGEDGEEWGVSFTTVSRAAAYDYLDDNYPESTVIDLADNNMIRNRESDRHSRLSWELDNDMDFPGYYD